MWRRVASERAGVSLTELVIVIAIMTTISMLAVPSYRFTLQQAKVTVAIQEIKGIQQAIEFYELKTGELPLTLDDLGMGPLVDPWGQPYRYLNFSTVQGKAQLRKDKFLVPINTHYDLYSCGPDGNTAAPLTAKASRDDIVRANDGDFVGVADRY